MLSQINLQSSQLIFKSQSNPCAGLECSQPSDRNRATRTLSHSAEVFNRARSIPAVGFESNGCGCVPLRTGHFQTDSSHLTWLSQLIAPWARQSGPLVLTLGSKSDGLDSLGHSDLPIVNLISTVLSPSDRRDPFNLGRQIKSNRPRATFSFFLCRWASLLFNPFLRLRPRAPEQSRAWERDALSPRAADTPHCIN